MLQWVIRSQVLSSLSPGGLENMDAVQRLDGDGPAAGMRTADSPRAGLRYSLLPALKGGVLKALKVAKCLVI